MIFRLRQALDKCKISFFDDMKLLQDLINVNEWFYRLEASFGSRRRSNVPKINVRCILFFSTAVSSNYK